MTRFHSALASAAALVALSLAPVSAHAQGDGTIDAKAQQWAATIGFDANAASRAEAMGEADFFLGFMNEYNETWSPGSTDRFDIGVPARFYQQTDRLFAFDLLPPADGFEGWDAYAEALTSIVARSSKFNVRMHADTFRTPATTMPPG